MSLIFVDRGDGLFSYDYIRDYIRRGLAEDPVLNRPRIIAAVACDAWEYVASRLYQMGAMLFPNGAVQGFPNIKVGHDDVLNCVECCFRNIDHVLNALLRTCGSGLSKQGGR